jgi:predicted molibdopterin-dependent oxidoreductase YjgC
MSPKTNRDWHSTACVLCSLNCGLSVRVEDNRIVKVKGDRSNPFSRGYTCPKGVTVGKVVDHEQRVREPLKRMPDGTHEPISWDQAISEIAEKLGDIVARCSPRSVGLVGGGAADRLPVALQRARAGVHAEVLDQRPRVWQRRDRLRGERRGVGVPPDHRVEPVDEPRHPAGALRLEGSGEGPLP